MASNGGYEKFSLDGPSNFLKPSTKSKVVVVSDPPRSFVVGETAG